MCDVLTSNHAQHLKDKMEETCRVIMRTISVKTFITVCVLGLILGPFVLLLVCVMLEKSLLSFTSAGKAMLCVVTVSYFTYNMYESDLIMDDTARDNVPLCVILLNVCVRYLLLTTFVLFLICAMVEDSLRSFTRVDKAMLCVVTVSCFDILDYFLFENNLNMDDTVAGYIICWIVKRLIHVFLLGAFGNLSILVWGEVG
jgi:hypothetical protein